MSNNTSVCVRNVQTRGEQDGSMANVISIVYGHLSLIYTTLSLCFATDRPPAQLIS